MVPNKPCCEERKHKSAKTVAGLCDGAHAELDAGDSAAARQRRVRHPVLPASEHAVLELHILDGDGGGAAGVAADVHDDAGEGAAGEEVHARHPAPALPTPGSLRHTGKAKPAGSRHGLYL